MLTKNSTGKEVFVMRNALSILMAIMLVIATSDLALADFTRIGTPIQLSATVTVTSAAGVITTLSASLRNVSDDATAANATWGDVTGGTDNWVSSNQYIDIQGFTTFANWGIQVLTNNKGATAIPQYTGSSNPVGLVNEVDTTQALPMCWRVTEGNFAFIPGSVDLDILEQTLGTGGVVLIREPADYIDDDDYFAPWFWMLDRLTPDVNPDVDGNQPFGDYQDYATLAGSSGIQIAPDTFTAIPSSDSHYFVYLGAKFTNAVGGATYSTNKIIVEMYSL